MDCCPVRVRNFDRHRWMIIDDNYYHITQERVYNEFNFVGSSINTEKLIVSLALCLAGGGKLYTDPA
jgi:hypothetical protein